MCKDEADFTAKHEATEEGMVNALAAAAAKSKRGAANFIFYF